MEQRLAPGAGWPLQWQRGRSHTHSATLLLRSKRRLAGRAAPEKPPLSVDGFHVNGSLNRRCVTALAARWAPSDPLLSAYLINKQRLKATMHLEGQHSDSLVALMLFVFEACSNSH